MRGLAALACAALAATGAAAQETAIVGVTVVDPASGTAAPGRTVLLSGGRIAAVGDARETPVPPGAALIDGAGRYLVPGLWDMHVHLSHLDAGMLPLFLAHGVTGVRDMGGRTGEVLAWRDAVAAGRMVGPRIVAPGPIVESPQWLEAVRERAGDLPGARGILEERMGVGSAEDAARAVDSARALGADFVKLRNNGSREAYFALLREARRAGVTVAGHAPRSIAPGEASDSGHASFEHAFLPTLDGMTAADRAALFRRFRRNGSAVTPTLIAGRNHRLLPDSVVLAALDDTLGARDPRMRTVPARLLARWREEWELTKRDAPRDWAAVQRSHLRDVGEMQGAGVRILAGTDVGVQLVHPGASLHEELALLVEEAGLTPAEALRAATLAPAEFLGRADRFGSVEAGNAADLVLLDADPLQDVRNLRRVRAVVAGGRVYDRAALDALVAAAERAAR